jgi:hypothetical protein
VREQVEISSGARRQDGASSSCSRTCVSPADHHSDEQCPKYWGHFFYMEALFRE